MKFMGKEKSKKSKRVVSSTVLYVTGIVVAVFGVALLVTNIVYFKSLLSQYVSQGYSAATVAKQLVPSQLLPAIFNSVGIYGGLAVLLIGAGIINEKVTKVSETSEISEVEEINKSEEANELKETEETQETELVNKAEEA